MIGANTPEDCTDFDRDAEIWFVGFRERLMACARSGGQAGGNVKSPPGCTYFSLDAEILGRRVPRVTAAVREASRSLVQGAAGRFAFLARPGARVGYFGLGPLGRNFVLLKAGGNLKNPPDCTDFNLDAGILGRWVPTATAGGSGSLKMTRGGGQIRFYERHKANLSVVAKTPRTVSLPTTTLR